MRQRLAKFVLFVCVVAFCQRLKADCWQAAVGGQSSDEAVQALAFLPNEMWIHAGECITWTFRANEKHSVTFLHFDPNPQLDQKRPTFAVGCRDVTNPPQVTTPDRSSFDGSGCVNSGLINTPGSTYTVFFPSPGNYVVVCLLHVNQTGTIHVLNPSETLPHDQDFYDRQAAVEERDLLSDHDGGQRAKLREDAPDSDEDHMAHSGMHIVVTGAGEISETAGGANSVSKMRFSHASVTIHAGDTVEWDSSDVSGHSITFGQEPPGGFSPLDPATSSPGLLNHDPDGALHATINSITDNVYSGRITPAPQERTGLGQLAPGATRFRVTFMSPGTYPYVCSYHDEIGMKGVVNVLP